MCARLCPRAPDTRCFAFPSALHWTTSFFNQLSHRGLGFHFCLFILKLGQGHNSDFLRSHGWSCTWKCASSPEEATITVCDASTVLPLSPKKVPKNSDRLLKLRSTGLKYKRHGKKGTAPKTDIENKPSTTIEKHKIKWDKKVVKLFFFRVDFVLLETKCEFSANIDCHRFASIAPVNVENGWLATQTERIWRRITSIQLDLAQVSPLLDTSYCSDVCATSAPAYFALTSVSVSPPSRLAQLLLTFRTVGGLDSILKPYKFQVVREWFCIKCAIAFSQNGHQFDPAVHGSIQLKYPARTRVMH